MVDVHPVTIELNGQRKTYTALFQTGEEFQPGWQSVLKAAYRHSELRCGCNGMGAKRLAVKHYDGSDSFALARFSLTGGQHAADCRFHGADPSQSGLGGYSAGVIDQRSDGSVKIRLEIGMLQRTDVVAPTLPRKTLNDRAPAAKQSSMKLLGLLHYLWAEAGLNQWKPSFAGKRKASLTYWWVNNAAENLWAGKVELSHQLLLPAFGAETRDAQRNRSRATAAVQTKHRMVLIAPLAAFTQERYDGMARQLKIAGFHGMPIAFMPTGLWETTVRRFQNAISAWRGGHGAVVIAQVELKQGPKGIYASVIDLGVMSVTAEFIPVESSYERIVAEKLVAEGRAFVKPMRYDAGSDQVFPDFILTDTPRHVPLEVFGRDDATYMCRKEEKRVYYDRQHGKDGWWSWDASLDRSGLNVPPFPARA